MNQIVEIVEMLDKKWDEWEFHQYKHSAGYCYKHPTGVEVCYEMGYRVKIKGNRVPLGFGGAIAIGDCIDRHDNSEVERRVQSMEKDLSVIRSATGRC
jgi:hypothetical protein